MQQKCISASVLQKWGWLLVCLCLTLFTAVDWNWPAAWTHLDVLIEMDLILCSVTRGGGRGLSSWLGTEIDALWGWRAFCSAQRFSSSKKSQTVMSFLYGTRRQTIGLTLCYLEEFLWKYFVVCKCLNSAAAHSSAKGVLRVTGEASWKDVTSW